MTPKYLTLRIQQNAGCHLCPCRLVALPRSASKALSGISEMLLVCIAVSRSILEEDKRSPGDDGRGTAHQSVPTASVSHRAPGTGKL